MNNNNQEVIGRRSLVAGMGAAVAGLSIAANTASAQNPSAVTDFQPTRHSQDAWLDTLPGGHRIFIDSSTALGGAEALLYAANLFNAQESAYSGSANDLALVVCLRHYSTAFAFGDDVWEKYGESLYEIMKFADPATGQAPTSNLMNAESRGDLPNNGKTISSLVTRGIQFAICANSTQYHARQLASRAGSSYEEVFQELIASAIPNNHFVSAGVMAATRAQEYRYSLLYAG